MENELIRVGILPTKGADIVEFRHKPQDLDVLWHSPIPVHSPGHQIPTSARSDGAFLDYYHGGWQEVFPSAGPATVYQGSELGVHGEVCLLPWDVIVIEDSPTRIEILFTVETVRLPFRLERGMSIIAGSPVVTLDERIINLGATDVAYEWGHHPAFGAPFIGAGCIIDLPQCDAVVSEAAKDLKRRLPMGPLTLDQVNKVLPVESQTEDVVLFSGFAEGWAAVRNPEKGLAVGISWDTATFPFLWCWQAYGGCFRAPFFGRVYTLALEPFNCPDETLLSLASRNAARVLTSGEQARTRLELGIYEAKSAISSIRGDGNIS
jgi:galactose mutarotase-like enzyme